MKEFLLFQIVFPNLILLIQDSTSVVDTTAVGYKIGIYLGSILPFIGLLIIFLLIIRKSYRFKNKKSD